MVIGLMFSLTACPGDEDDDDSMTYQPAVTNLAPTAIALGPAGLIPVGETAALDGSASFDVDGDDITFLWEWVSRPSGSNATLNAANTNAANFTVDVGGTYTARLTVSDGTASGTDQAQTTALGIGAITPSVGAEGTAVTISGANFWSPQVVTFNGVEATVQSATNDEIVALAPVGGSTGAVNVSAAGVSVTGPVYTYGSPPPVCTAAGEEPVADAYIRGAQHADTKFGLNKLLLLKGTHSLEWARKIYLVFDISSLPASFSSVTLRLTLERHVSLVPRDVSIYGITDNADWDPGVLAEGDIAWNTAPRNRLIDGIRFEGQGATPADGVRLLTTQTLDNADPAGTTYDFDITQFVQWALGNDAAFSTAAAGGDTDGLVTLLIAHSDVAAPEGSVFHAREASDACVRPQLVVQ
jgi:hypothetical protein